MLTFGKLLFPVTTTYVTAKVLMKFIFGQLYVHFLDTRYECYLSY
jgi:hypothetical protein